LIGRAIKGRREKVVIGTKFAFRIDDDGRYVPGVDGSPVHARKASEGALRRLGVDALDLFYLHRVDPAIPIEESVGGMGDLVKQGKVRHLDLCEVSASTLRKACAVHPIAAIPPPAPVTMTTLLLNSLPISPSLSVQSFLDGQAEKVLICHDKYRTLPDNLSGLYIRRGDGLGERSIVCRSEPS
jgi:hypothetical protein